MLKRLMKYALGLGSNAMRYMPSSINICSGIQKSMKGD
jgi:hypothetical protein